MKLIKHLLLHVCIITFVLSCAKEENTIESQTFKVDFEKFTLDNGLQVIFHVDRSDPVVAVALTTHVGSAREIEGRTGFAHLFEHLLFLESENLGKGGLDKMSARIGGSGANGSTSRDRTNYFQTVPKDALEKMIWAEADKLGFFINTVTDQVLAKEKQVVKNEKRQGVDNRPFGHNSYVIDKNLYPEGHPYNWQVIGSLEDLQSATLQDVKDFYNRWYVPNNVTLTIAGDFDTAQAKLWVEKYFSEIKRGEDIPKMEKQPVTLSQTKKIYYEDNFANVPRLTLTWPGVHNYHPDAYALDVLATYLAQGKQAPLYKAVVEDQKLSDRVSAYQYNSEIAGQFMLQVTAYSDTDLQKVLSGIEEGFAKFEEEGISEAELKRIKAGQETDFYNSLSSVLGKGFQLAQYEIFAGDPGFVNQDVKNILAVTPEDVMRVYEHYIKDKNFVATSFVPKDQKELALEDSRLAEVVEEPIVDGAEETFDASLTTDYEKTPSSFDRSIEPPYGESPEVKVPVVWEEELSSGLKVFGIEHHEVPLVQFEMQLKGGMLLENPEKTGVSNLLAELLTKGTAGKTPEELENAIEMLGASINVRASRESINIYGTSLARNYEETIALVQEILLQPRWDEKEFNLLKQSTLAQIERQKSQPNSIAELEFNKLIYGEDHLLSNDNLGTQASVNAIDLEDLKAYYTDNFSPNITKFHVVGSITQDEVTESLLDLNTNWTSRAVEFPDLPEPEAPAASKVYFYDIPGAKQSVLRFGYPALAATDADFYPATLLNYRLGGGGFASQLTQQLREGKGYTYGIRSGFSGTNLTGPFQISSGVRSNVTYESTSLIKEILENYGNDYNEKDLEITKSYMIKSNARAFETIRNKLNMLTDISNYGYAVDYARQREAVVRAMTVDDMKALAEQYITPDAMIYLIVGDASTQLNKLEQLGFGKPVLLNE
ncbi:insulinase family protein [Psychroflexus sp. YR1-1]|uniref:Insulinase family protein n=1 Tax=Psychroflexus aurantiacus TaxID=2709310 RepID=A0A6B3QX14_9FLAO|nr:pitrilysin family protein [Psychroflexus aurantiacus]NEV92653.1 insulinase family protein [Psychroflexus aurantiacus]